MATETSSRDDKSLTPDSPESIVFVAPNVTVREYRLSDVQSVSRQANNLKIWLMMRDTFPYPYTEQASVDWIKRCQDRSQWKACGPFDPVTKTGTGPLTPTFYTVCVDDVAVGAIGLVFGKHVNRCRTADLGYWIGEEFWGRGTMGQVAREFVRWSWRTFGSLVRLHSDVMEGNEASCKILEKAGFEFEYLAKAELWKENRILNMYHFGFVRDGI